MGGGGGCWIHVARDRKNCRTPVNTIIELLGSIKRCKLLEWPSNCQLLKKQLIHYAVHLLQSCLFRPGAPNDYNKRRPFSRRVCEVTLCQLFITSATWGSICVNLHLPLTQTGINGMVSFPFSLSFSLSLTHTHFL
jgi:hypothetical protein